MVNAPDEYEYRLLPALLRAIATERTDVVGINALIHSAEALERMQNIANELIELQARHDELQEVLRRIANMTDRDGNAIEMHQQELRGIARAASANTENKV